MTTLTGGIEYEDFREPGGGAAGARWGEGLKDTLWTLVRVAGPIALAWAKGRFLDEPASYGRSLAQSLPQPHWTELSTTEMPRKAFQPLALPDNPLEIPASRYDKPAGFFTPPPQRKLFQMALPWRNPRGGSLQDLTPGLNQGELLTLPQTRQAFHTLNLERHGGKLDDWGYQALERQLHHRLSTNWMAAAPRTPEGWVTMAGVAVPPQHAYGMARANFHHIAERDYPLEPETAQALLAMRQVPDTADYKANTAYEFLNHSHVPTVTTTPPSDPWPPKGVQPYQFPWVPKDSVEFPKNPPDVTRNQRLYVEGIAKEVQAMPLDLGHWLDFRTGARWDVKGKPGIPPSQYHWALYKGKLVNDMYLANHAFGYAWASAGLPLGGALYAGQLYASNTDVKIDQPEDQAAIISGWREFHTGNPWPEGLPTPKDFRTALIKNPEAYNYWRHHFKEMPTIQKFLD